MQDSRRFAFIRGWISRAPAGAHARGVAGSGGCARYTRFTPGNFSRPSGTLHFPQPAARSVSRRLLTAHGSLRFAFAMAGRPRSLGSLLTAHCS